MPQLKKESGLDGHLVYVANGLKKMPELNSSNTFFLGKDSKRFTPYDTTFVSGFFNLNKDWGGEKIPEDRTDADKIIISGRFIFSMLLNTFGGIMGVYYELKEIAEMASKGKVHAFGKEKVCSAGASSFTLPQVDCRFLNSDTQLLFHLSHMSSRSCNRERYIQDLKKEILEATLQEKRLEMEKKIDAILSSPVSKEADCPIVFHGKEAEELGLCQTSPDLEKTFQQVHRVDPSTYQHTPIAEFFQ